MTIDGGRRRSCGFVIAALTGAIAAGGLSPIAVATEQAAVAATEDAGATSFSEAETLLWMTNQLRSVTAPTVLTYSFVKDGSYEGGFQDRVVFTVEKIHEDGMKAASLDFFTGQRHFPVPAAESTNVNPVLKVFFQGDVYEMNRLTDPNGAARERWRYFQRRIKLALAETATVEPVKVQFDGVEYDAKRITFEPYKKDPKRDAFEKFADKRYSVTVSDALPGYLYEIVTEVPDKNAPVPLLRDTLRLQAVAPYRATADVANTQELSRK